MEISESAWAKAYSISSEIRHTLAVNEAPELIHDRQDIRELIARAIMEERRECAEIAEEYSYFHKDELALSLAGNAISQAIRNK